MVMVGNTFLLSNVVGNSVVTVVDERCSEEKQVFMKTYFSY